MLRRIQFLTLAVLFVVFGVAAAETKKPAGKSTKTTTTIKADTSTITVSEGTTAQAMRGIVATDGPPGSAVIGFSPADSIVTARDRHSGGTFKFKVPAHSNVHVGDRVTGDFKAGVAIGGLADRFHVYGGTPCCAVAAIDSANHTLLVGEAAVGRTFVVNNQSPDGVRIGQPVEADFKAGTAWIAGNSALKGQITNLSQPVGLRPY